MTPYARAGLSAAFCLLTGAAAAEMADGQPFVPERFFAGRTVSTGIVLRIDGELENRLSGTTRGRRARDGATVFDQVIRFDDGKVTRRRWRLVRTGPTTIEATATDVVGPVQGTIDGDELRLAYTMRVDPKDPRSDVQFDQTLTLQPDGRTVVNHADVRKFGLPVRTVEEVFVRR